ncbi:Immunoglobulin I-set domain protein [Phycisphaerae bacterium RAS1]|nr:Immunoglobulin I-set domain protein [Phycisphaerae bacterium RAS1]
MSAPVARNLLVTLTLTLIVPVAIAADLFFELPISASAEVGVKRVRIVQLDSAALPRQGGDGSVALSLNLFDDVALHARPTVVERSDAGLHMVGRIENRPHGTFSLSIVGDQIVGDINLPAEDEVYRLRPMAEGPIRVEQLDLSAILPCGQLSLPPPGVAPILPSGAGHASESGARGDEPPLVDVLVVYTPSARNYWGGTATTLATIRTWALDTNQYYVNSTVNARIRLVHMQEVAYTESGSSSSDLSFLTNFDDTIDEVHTLRGEHGADMVVMLTNVGDVCGIGWLYTGGADRAFSITSVRCLSLTFAHELGHNFGCCHDRANAGGGCFNSQSYGWRFNGQGGTLWRTIMAYAPGTRIGYFSNPNINYDGIPTGTNGEYNARTIGLTAPTVSTYLNAAPFDDCNQNLIADDLDIIAGAGSDVNGNGILDACDDSFSGWNQLSTAPGDPPARNQHALARDTARDAVVLFGGQNGANLGDTWEWTAAGGWQQRAGGGPSPRQGHGLAFDDQRDRTVLFGGFDGAFSGQTWEWDGSSWTQSPVSGPSPRRDSPLAFDAARGQIVLLGGFNGGNLDDTWTYDGAAWTLRNPPNPRPSPRRGHALAYDSARDVVLLFGGTNGSQILGDLWQWNGAEWSQLAPGGGPNSPAAAFAAMAFDDSRGVAVLSGGTTASGSSSQTWEWNGMSWSLRSSGTPGARTEAAMAYDESRGVTLLFGGFSGGPAGDTWELRRREPVITQQPTNQRVCEGSGFTLSIAATSGISYPLSYQWYKDGFPLLGGTGPVYSTGFSGVGTPGEYTCVVSNLYGSATSDAVHVDLDHPVQITLVSPFPGQTVCAGDPATFWVTASGSSQLQYQWRKGSTDIAGANGGSYTIPSVALADAGLYRVLVTSQCGPLLSPSVSLDVRPCGDANCDGSVNVLDINAFVLALQDADAYAQQYPSCPIENADMNGDERVDVLDINPFVARLSGG